MNRSSDEFFIFWALPYMSCFYFTPQLITHSIKCLLIVLSSLSAKFITEQRADRKSTKPECQINNK